MQPMTPVRSVNGTVSATLQSAFVRSIFLAIVSGLTTVLMTRQIEAGDGTPTSWEECLVAGGIVALTTITARLGFEGGYDARRQTEGTVNPSDVQTNPPAVVVAPIDSPAHEGGA
jgi:hypothetical protein